MRLSVEGYMGKEVGNRCFCMYKLDIGEISIGEEC